MGKSGGQTACKRGYLLAQYPRTVDNVASSKSDWPVVPGQARRQPSQPVGDDPWLDLAIGRMEIDVGGRQQGASAVYTDLYSYPHLVYKLWITCRPRP